MLLTPLPAEDRRQFNAQLVVRVGKPSREILAYAEAKQIDRLVIGRGDHGSPEAATEMASITEAVARGASCPVLVVPARAARREMGRRKETA